VVSSRVVAEDFGKRHDHVLRDIENLISEGASPISGTPLFIESEYTHPQNKQTYKEFLLSRDGFTLLAMGFTGKEALQWKLKYIEAFNKMETELKKRQLNLPTTLRECYLELAKVEEEKERLNETISILEPKATRHDEIYNSPVLKTTSEIAKDLGMSATRLNNILKKKGIIYKKGKIYYLYAKYEHLIQNGFCDYSINEFTQTLKWTEKGRAFIMDAVAGQQELGLFGGLMK